MSAPATEPFDLREMTVEDVGVVLTIIRAHQEDDGRLARKYFDSVFGDTERARRETNFVAVDRATGEVAGVGGFGPDSMEWPGILWLRWLYVAEEHRGRGLGGRLLRRILEGAASRGARKVYLDTSSDESYAAAIAMYEKYGFRLEGRLADYYEAGEDYLIYGLEV